MKLKVKNVDVMASSPAVGMDPADCAEIGVKENDRVRVSNGKAEMSVLLLTSDAFVNVGEVLVPNSVAKRLKVKDGDEVDVVFSPSPESVRSIRKKMDGEVLTDKEIQGVVNDIYLGSLSNIEVSSWLTALYINGMNIDEIAAFARAMVDTGDVIPFDRSPVFDFHSMGGVPGNKITPIVVSIVAAAGLMLPKTSSRAISSACGTSDFVETFCGIEVTAEKLKEIEEYYDKCADEGASEYQIEESKKAMSSMEVLLSDPKLIRRIAEDFVLHYEKRIEEGSTVEGKAMFVTPSRRIAWMLYKDIIELRPEWGEARTCPDYDLLSSEQQKKLKPIERVKMVITRDKDDEKELYDILGNEDYRKDLADQYKEVKSNFKIAIVVDMWITGFDVPSLDTMYVFKPLQKHTLIQTISRVNRVYPGKDKGLVVDYLGIKNNMNKALLQYGTGDEENPGIDTTEQSLIIVRDQLDLIRRLLKDFDYSGFNTGTPLQQLDVLNKTADYIIAAKEREILFMGYTKKMSEAYNLCSCSESITQQEDDDIHFFKAVRSIIYKLTKGEAPDAARMNKRVLGMIREAFLSQEVEEISKIGVEKEVEIDVLSEQYMERLKRIPYQNTKVKLIERLLKQVIDKLMKVNKMKAIDFTSRLNEIVKQYNDRSDNTTIANEVIDAVVNQMEQLLHEVNNERTAADQMGISYEEKAFYDILKAVRDKFGFEYEEDKLIHLAQEVKRIVDDKARYVDWSTRADRKAELKMDLVIILADNGYPPYTKDEVFKEILEQAENFKKHAQ